MLIANGEVFSEICKDRLIAINGDSKVVVAYKGDKVAVSIKNGILTIKNKETGKIVKKISENNGEVCVDVVLEERKPAKVKYKSSRGGSVSCDGNLIGNNCRIRIVSHNENFDLYNGINLGVVSYGTRRDVEEKVSSLGNLNEMINKDIEKVINFNNKENKGNRVKVNNKGMKMKNINGQHIDLGLTISSRSELQEKEPIVIDNSGKKITGKKLK